MFSGHAARRMEQRGVQLDNERMRRLETAVGRAEAKGSRDSLILLDDLALVVSIQNRTVVTAVDEDSSAAEAGLRRGDVIQEINRKPIISRDEYERAVSGAGTQAVLLLVNRGGATSFIVVEPR